MDTPTQRDVSSTLPPRRNMPFRPDEMQMYIGFIRNILGNLGALPKERLQSMLSAIAPGYKGKEQAMLELLLEEAESQRILRRNAKGEWSIIQ